MPKQWLPSPDDEIRSADWPKRTPDTLAALDVNWPDAADRREANDEEESDDA
jgi:hypothetical protein